MFGFLLLLLLCRMILLWVSGFFVDVLFVLTHLCPRASISCSELALESCLLLILRMITVDILG